MNLAAGHRLGPYEIVSPIGAGGMGEVFRARDTRLDRSVAIKILPAEFAANESLKIRFDREAKTISQLNHPHICTLFDVGESSVSGSKEGGPFSPTESVSYLVMELLEGESLAERLARGPLSLQEVIRYGAQIAEALDRAHRAGVVHRDLKPGNIMITKSGAKLLDFGLAKSGAALVGADPVSSAFAAGSATQMKPLTEQGQIIGTFQYMAPEQLEGAEADPRTDIFALGAVLYEMITGQRAFEGKNKTSLIAAIVSGAPRPINELQPMTPAMLEHIILRCLEKDPDYRWQSAHDVAEELKWIGSRSSQSTTATALAVPRRFLHRWIVPGIAAFALVVAASGITWYATRDHDIPLAVVRADVSMNPGLLAGTPGTPFALSRDGRTIAYVGVAPEGDLLVVRRLDRGSVAVLPDTRGARNPAFSYDGQWIVYSSPFGMRKIPVSGGTPQLIAEGSTFGAHWTAGGEIYFGTDQGVEKVRHDGTERAMIVSSNGGNRSFVRPSLLPDKRTLLLEYNDSGSTRSMIGLYDLQKKSLRDLRSGANPRYLRTGQILYTEGNTLYAAKFDGREVTSPAPVLAGIAVHPVTATAFYDVSDTGVLLYRPGTVAMESGVLSWIDRNGRIEPLALPPRPYAHPRLSRDGKRVALAIRDALTDIWILNLERQTLGRLTFEPSENEMPSWMPDDRSIIFSASRKDEPRIHFLKSFDGTGAEKKVFNAKHHQHISSVSSDGKYALVTEFHPQTGTDVWVYTVDGSEKPRPLLVNKFDEHAARFSPDGKWIAYTSAESGTQEIYVIGFTAGGKWQISGNGGRNPVWSRDGKELFYLEGQKMMSVALVQTDEGFNAGIPKFLFEGKLQLLPRGDTNYDVAPDGRFLGIAADSGIEGHPLQVIVNWFEEIAPANK